MKPLWKVKGFEKQTYQPQQTGKDTRTDNSDAQDKQTHGHGHNAAQHKTAEENKIDRETQKAH